MAVRGWLRERWGLFAHAGDGEVGEDGSSDAYRSILYVRAVIWQPDAFGVPFEHEAAAEAGSVSCGDCIGQDCGCKDATIPYEAALDEHPQYGRSSGYFVFVCRFLRASLPLSHSC
jgi:hypothetical protein